MITNFRTVLRAGTVATALAAIASSALAQPYVGEIRWVGFNFAPQGWARCDGQLMAIADNDALFSLIGTTYGGDGVTTFALPDARGRLPLHQGQGPGLTNHVLGELGGAETVTLTQNQMPAHAHTVYGSNAIATSVKPENNFPAYLSEQNGSAFDPTTVRAYRRPPGTTPMAADMIGLAGGNQPHENLPPFNNLTCIISLLGIFPVPN
jgi:microcystin-dependent protein